MATQINVREIILETLLLITRDGEYSHIALKNVLDKYSEFPTAMQGLGYKEVVEYLNGSLNRDEMIEKIKQETRRYAKRQITWFKSYKNGIVLDARNKNNPSIIVEELSEK